MKVLILSPYPESIIKTLEESKDTFLVYDNQITIDFLKTKKSNLLFRTVINILLKKIL